MFSHRKLGDHDLEMFLIGIRPPPLYIQEDHGRLKDPTLSHQKIHLLPSFTLLQPSCCSLHLSVRFIGVLGSLAGPRTTLGVLLPNGSSQEAFPGFCGIGRALDWPNRSLDWFSHSWSCLLLVLGCVQPRVS
jgi:hypothetical protein